MQYKTLLLASFVEKNNLHNFLNDLSENHRVKKDKIFVFDLNENTHLLTYNSGLGVGNINHKEHQIDWTKYENMLILLRGDKLEISDISRVFLSDS